MEPMSNESIFICPDFKLARNSCFVSVFPSGPMPTQSSARIRLSLSLSPAFSASSQSFSSCLTLSAVLAAFGACVCVFARASPTQTQINRIVPANFFIISLLCNFPRTGCRTPKLCAVYTQLALCQRPLPSGYSSDLALYVGPARLRAGFAGSGQDRDPTDTQLRLPTAGLRHSHACVHQLDQQCGIAVSKNIAAELKPAHKARRCRGACGRSCKRWRVAQALTFWRFPHNCMLHQAATEAKCCQSHAQQSRAD